MTRLEDLKPVQSCLSILPSNTHGLLSANLAWQQLHRSSAPSSVTTERSESEEQPSGWPHGTLQVPLRTAPKEYHSTAKELGRVATCVPQG